MGDAKRICFVGGRRYSWPLDATTLKKFNKLRELGELFVIGFSEDLRPRQFTAAAHFFLLPQIPLPILRYVAMFSLGPVIALWLIFRHGVQTIVAQSPYEGFAAAWAKEVAGWFGRKIALVVEAHGDFEESLFLYRRILFRGLYHPFMRRAAEFAFYHADVLRANSNSVRHQLRRWAPDKTIVQFPTWTDIDAFLQMGSERTSHSSQEILYAGALIPLKGIHHLVNAFALVASAFPQARLTIIGREQNKTYAGELRAQVEQLGLISRVTFIGEIPQAELARWMQRASVLVLPSLSEGLGRVLVEAMATRTPVIGSHVGGIPEIIQDGVTGHLVMPGDEVALADRLRWVFEHPKDAQEMGFRAHAFAKRFFSTEAYVQGYREIFEKAQSMLGGEKPRYASSAL